MTVALQADGTLWAWCGNGNGNGNVNGNGNGTVGDGTATDRTSPTKIGGGTDWAAVAAGFSFTLALERV